MGLKGYNKQKYNDITISQRKSIKQSWEKGDMSNPDIMKKYNISHANLYKLIKEWNEEKISTYTVKKTGGSVTTRRIIEETYGKDSLEYRLLKQPIGESFDVDNFEKELYKSHEEFN
jgi:transposase